MKSKLSLLPLVLVLILATFSLAACGSDDEGYSENGEGYSESEATSGAEPGGSTTSPSQNAPAPSGEAVRAAKVTIADYAYDPDPVRVQVGGKVIWQNEDSVAHTATAEDGSFDTGPIDEGKLKSETFKEPGTFTYVCKFHAGMKGTVEVVEKGQ